MTEGAYDPTAAAIERQFKRQTLERKVIDAAMAWREKPHDLDGFEALLHATDCLATALDADKEISARERGGTSVRGCAPRQLAPAGPAAAVPSPQPPGPAIPCTAENPCCSRRSEYNGFGSVGPWLFTCPKSCSCHD